jgi:hypothetical protein
LVLLAPAGQATQRGASPAGVDYVSGGVSHEEQVALHARRADYNFWLTTAVRRTGAHLAGVMVRIRETGNGRLVLEHRMDGPWLFANLPLGRYEVEAVLQSDDLVRTEVQRGSTQIHPGDHHQMLLYFSTSDTVGEENANPLPGNPYDGEPKKK